MIVKCQHCGTKLKVGETLVPNQHIMCPCCNKKFAFNPPLRIRMPSTIHEGPKAPRRRRFAPILLRCLYIIGTIFCIFLLLMGWSACFSTYRLILSVALNPSVGAPAPWFLVFALLVATLCPMLLWIVLRLVYEVFIALFDIESNTRTCASLMRRLVSEQDDGTSD